MSDLDTRLDALAWRMLGLTRKCLDAMNTEIADLRVQLDAAEVERDGMRDKLTEGGESALTAEDVNRLMDLLSVEGDGDFAARVLDGVATADRCRRLAAERDAMYAKLENLEDDDQTEAMLYEAVIENCLPEYVIEPSDDDDENHAELANHAERIEYAGKELSKLRAWRARHEPIVLAAQEWLEHDKDDGTPYLRALCDAIENAAQ